VFGPPVDFEDLEAEKPRPTLYKKAADRFMTEVRKCSEIERGLRADLMAGKISQEDPRWLENRGMSKLYAREG